MEFKKWYFNKIPMDIPIKERFQETLKKMINK